MAMARRSRLRPALPGGLKLADAGTVEAEVTLAV
jgi:hypothetical protein